MIDREKVVKGLEYCTTVETSDDCKGCPYNGQCGINPCALERDALELLKAQTTIVRCKDCKHQDPDRLNDGSNRYVCRKGHGWKPDDWFCADGERR